MPSTTVSSSSQHPHPGDLETVELWLEASAAPLLPQVRAALGARGEALRWAITAVEPGASGGRRLRIEAVLLGRP